MFKFSSFMHKGPEVIGHYHHPEKTNYHLVKVDHKVHHLKDKHGEVLHTFVNADKDSIHESLSERGFMKGHHAKFK